nr:gustatory receptor 22.1 [Papilio memnon]
MLYVKSFATRNSVHGIKYNKMNTLTSNINTFDRILLAVKPITTLEKCLGIFRFRLNGESCEPAKRRMRFIGFLIYLIIAILYLTQTITYVTEGNIATKAADILPCVIIFLQYTITIVIQLFVDDYDFINLFTLLENIDCSLHVNIDDNLYKNSRVQVIKILNFLGISYVAMIIFNIFNEMEIKIEYYISLFIYFESELEIAYFYVLIGMLRKRVVIINRYLSKFTSQRLYNKTFKRDKTNTIFVIENCVNYIGRASAGNMKIRDLTETYCQIGEACRFINKIFNLVILTTFISTFLFIITTFWTSLYYFKSNKTFRYLLKIVVWSCSQVVAMIMLSINCEKLLQEKEKTKFLVNKLVMDYELPKAMRMQAKVFMETLNIWPLRVFIYDMFSADVLSIFKVISLCASYLIVVIQVTQ